MPEGLPFINGLLKKEGLLSLVNRAYKLNGPEVTIRLLDAMKDVGFLWAMKAGVSVGIDDLVVPPTKARLLEAANKEVRAIEHEYLPRRQAGRRHPLQPHPRSVGPHRRAGGHGHDEGTGKAQRDRRVPELHLHHGRLRRPRLQDPDPPGGRHARPDGQALRRHHRDPHHRQLQGGPQRPAVLHLHPRRPQGPGRHRPQDRRLRLPHPQAGGRGPGRDHQRGRLRHPGRHRGEGHRQQRRHHPLPPARPDHGPGGAGRRPGSLFPGGHRPGRHPALRGTGLPHRDLRHHQRQDPLGAHLRSPPRRLRQVLRPEPVQRPAWSTWARRWASSPPSPSASPAPSSPCAPSTWAAPPAAPPRSPPTRPRSPASSGWTASATWRTTAGELIAISRSGNILVVDASGNERESYKIAPGAIIRVRDGEEVRAQDRPGRVGSLQRLPASPRRPASPTSRSSS